MEAAPQIAFAPLTPLCRGALKRREAAAYLAIGLTKLDMLAAAEEIHKTSYGTFPVVSLNAHLEREAKRRRRPKNNRPELEAA